MARVDRKMRDTVWTAGGCDSWYLDATGRNSVLWPGYTFTFRHLVEYCDGWMPIHGRRGIADKLDELRASAAEAGRDMDTIELGVFGCPADPKVIDDYAALLTEYGLPQDFIWLLNHLFTEVLGSKARLADGVQRALGRQPKDFADYAREAAARN